MMIDIFNHFMPKAYLDRLGALIPGHVALTAFPRLKTLWDVDARLSLLDEFDGLQQVLSLANPPLELIAPSDQTPALARLANDALAELCSRHPDRFPAFIASLPMNNIEASLAESMLSPLGKSFCVRDGQQVCNGRSRGGVLQVSPVYRSPDERVRIAVRYTSIAPYGPEVASTQVFQLERSEGTWVVRGRQ